MVTSICLQNFIIIPNYNHETITPPPILCSPWQPIFYLLSLWICTSPFWMNNIGIKWLRYYLYSKPISDKATTQSFGGAGVIPNSLESVDYLLRAVNQLQVECKPDRKPDLSGRPQGSLKRWAMVFWHVLAKGLVCSLLYEVKWTYLWEERLRSGKKEAKEIVG